MDVQYIRNILKNHREMDGGQDGTEEFENILKYLGYTG